MEPLTALEVNLSSLGKLSEDDARKMLERLRWPDGPACPHCGVIGEATGMASASKTKKKNKLRAGVWNCRACRKPFSVTVGTIFEGSHIPLAKWLMAFFLYASAKKSMSALQLQRQLDLGSYRTAWHMAHRIRHAMQNDPEPGMLSGVVEADEVHIGGKIRRNIGRNNSADGQSWKRRQAGAKAWQAKRVPVAVLVSRDGQARARALEKVTGKALGAFIKANVDTTKSTLHTDEHPGYAAIGKEFSGGHHAVNHSEGEYARAGGIHSNTAEAFNGLFKRSVQGSWHHISREHIGRYLDEQCFRWSHRKVTDGERTVAALGRVDGVRLYYKQPTQPEQGSQGLVASR